VRHAVRFAIHSIAVLWGVLVGMQAAPASAQRKVALIIGNATYGHHGGLPNVPNDAVAMAGLFKSAMFDFVDVRHNLGVAELRRALRDFAGRAADADVAVLFYAGHGIEVGQTNYLVPVDARLATDFDVEDEAVPLDRVLQAMEPAKRLRLVILDACRENPFVRSMKRTIAARAVGRGLARTEPSTTDTLIAYATRPNAVAEDGRGQNSPFTAALVKHLLTPGLDLRIALGQVRDEVLATTARKQEPYVTGSLGGATVSLAVAVTVGAPKAGVAPQAAMVTETARVCREVEGMSNPATLAVLERQHKGTPAGECVAARMEQLRAVAVVPPPAPPKAATMDGLWQGTLHQNPAATSVYPVELTMRGGNGTVAYPTLGCGGSLTPISGDATRMIVRERLTYGHAKCIDGGEITLQLLDERLAFTWSGAHLGMAEVATGVLSRKAR
jgi:hypothetical protein